MRGCRTSSYNYETGLAASVSTSEAGVICCSQLSRHKSRTSISQNALPAGENDATVILKPTPGSKRTRYVRDLQAAAYLGNLHTDSNYTIILGSHRNSCLKFEKDLQPRHQASITLWSLMFGCTHSTTLLAPETVSSITGPIVDSSTTRCCLVWPQHICLCRQMASLAPS